MKRIILAIIVLLLGLGVLGYPTVSNYLSQKNGSYALDTYEKEVKKQSKELLSQEWAKAQAFNETLAGNPVRDPFIEGSGYAIQSNYFELLTINNMMGKLEIPKIKVEMPIYHGTSEKTLKRGIGHLEASSLPVGGKNTLSVLTGHTGLTAGKMLTDLTELQKGDLYYVSVLGKTLAYKVDQIQVVLPEETDALKLVKGQDHCTLLTCTPYGVNSHLLLVRGVRTKYIAKEKAKIKPIKKSFENQKVLIAALATAAVMLLLIGVRIYVIYKKQKE